jgi:hypothetical protein
MACRFGPRATVALGLFVCLVVAAIAPTASGAAAQTKSAAGSPAGPGPAAGHILLVWGVGGVLADDGNLWQYRPEKVKWVTIDESFRMDGEQRKLLPLPVAAHDVRFMQGFGFLVTRAGVAWLYDLDQNRWRNIGSPLR